VSGVGKAEPAAVAPVDRHEHGVSLLEIMVVLLLLSIIMGSVITGFISVQRSANNDLVREQGIEQAEIGMQVITRDLRATADSPTSGSPMISTMSLSSVTFASDIDTTSSANPPAVGTASSFAGCPDQITISGSTSTPGTITETRTHPDPAVSPSTVVASCTWTGHSTPRTRVLATAATLSFRYLAYADPTSGVAPQTSTSPATTAAVTVTIRVPPSNNSPAVPAATLVQTVQFAGFTNSLSNAGS
jgi:prepilin-type N-terminal cleavage/methylation domain-containing protein